jgi:hypothetical protein
MNRRGDIHNTEEISKTLEPPHKRMEVLGLEEM